MQKQVMFPQSGSHPRNRLEAQVGPLSSQEGRPVSSPSMIVWTEDAAALAWLRSGDALHLTRLDGVVHVANALPHYHLGSLPVWLSFDPTGYTATVEDPKQGTIRLGLRDAA